MPKCQGKRKTVYTQRLVNKQFSMYNDFFATNTEISQKIKYNINTLNKTAPGEKERNIETFIEEPWKNSESKRQH